MAQNKTKATAASVDGFIAALADSSRQADARALVKIMRDATGEPAKMWGPSIIGFGHYHYVYESGREGDMPLVGFSPRKAAIVLYLHASLFDSDALLAKLGKHTAGKGCIYLKSLADADAKALAQLVARSAAAIRKKYPAEKTRKSK